jgi:erythritol kinase (D-erythritol 1-phosphate-forming)
LHLGLYEDMPACVEAWVGPALGDFISPDANLTKIYRELYLAYLAIRQAMPPAWGMLGSIRQETSA